MLANLSALLAPALMERLTLVVNHVLAAEPAATARLAPHAGRRIRLVLEGWPGLLPPLPALAFQVTPAGLMEWSPSGDEFDLEARVDAGNPAALALRAAQGERPAVAIGGDAALASEVNWLLQNLRWDVGGDLERLFGPLVGAELHRLGSLAAAGLKQTLAHAASLKPGFGGMADRAQPLRPGGR